MKSVKFTVSLALLCSVLFTISSCKKVDWGHVPPSLNRNCDYVSGNSPSYYDDNQQPADIFRKFYDPGTYKLNRIFVDFHSSVGIYIAGNEEGADTLTYQVTYPTNRIVLTGPLNNLVTFNFSTGGQLQTASFDFPLDNYQFQFKYSGGRLSQILYRNQDSPSGAFANYVKISYDAGKKNIKRLELLDDRGSVVDYEYDYSKKPAAQYYCDEVHFSHYGFWKLLKEMNLLPELRPANLVTRSYLQHDGYPGNRDLRYTNQQFNAAGQLVSYTSNVEEYGHAGVSQQQWTVNWTCFNKNK